MSSRADFRPDIEGLRAVAIILVLLYHAQIPWFSGGFVGVDVFFVISGFLITRSLLSEVYRTGTVRLTEFYARRVRRLLPASALALAATGIGIWVALPSSMWRNFGGDIVAAGAYVVNWRFALRSVDYLAQDVLPSPVQHFWSLSVEEQFYFIWPALIIGAVVLARRVARPVRPMTGAVLVAGVLIPSLTWSILSSGHEPTSAFFVTTTRLWELAAGALTAVIGTRILNSRPLRVLLKASALLALALTAILVDGSVAWPGLIATVPIFATVLLILGGGDGDVIDRALSVRPMRSIGAWSYSLYLWHWPLLAILSARWGGLTVTQAVLITIASFIPAVAAYKWVETPLRFQSSLRASPALTISVGSSLTLAAVVVGLGVSLAAPVADLSPVTADDSEVAIGAEALEPDAGAEALFQQLRATTTFVPSPATATEDRPSIYDEGCQVDQTEIEPVVCERGDPNGRWLVIVAGDSKVAQWEPALDVIGRRRGWKILTVTKSACELTTTMPDAPSGGPYESCFEWSSQVLSLIGEVDPDAVVVSQGSGTGWNKETSTSESMVLVEGMLGAYDWVVDQGSDLIILLDNPSPPLVVRDCVAENPDELRSCVFEVDGRDSSGGRAAQRQAARLGGYHVIDMTDVICPSEICLPVIGGVLVYRDGSHITASYISSMARELENRLVPFIEGDKR